MALLPQIGQHHHFMLQDFFASTVTAPRVALVGVGVDPMHLTKLASAMQLSSEKGAADVKVHFVLVICQISMHEFFLTTECRQLLGVKVC